ncbi:MULTISPECIES: hypothetical protein [unclassified Asaia]|uniref:hypothetical protein n=1 Tax=unclassified Asaia TaxID=2685023 RepID=UPI0013156A85|nr:hypothetical protein [Asaia sp. W19]
MIHSHETRGYHYNRDIDDGAFRPLDLLTHPYLLPGSYVKSFFCKWENIRTILIAR